MTNKKKHAAACTVVYSGNLNPEVCKTVSFIKSTILTIS